MSVEDLYGLMIAWAIMSAITWIIGLTLITSALRHWYGLPFRAVLGGIAVAAAVVVACVDVVGYARARELPVDPWWIVGLGLVGGLLIAHWLANREPDDAPRPAPEGWQRRRLAGKTLVGLGFVAAPLAMWSSVSAGLLLLTWTIGSILWIAGAATSHAQARHRSREAAGHDPRLAEQLGRWIDGRWVCFQHQRTWCQICSPRTARPVPGPQPTSKEDEAAAPP